MAFQTKEVSWIKTQIGDKSSNRFIANISPLGDAEIARFAVPAWALRDGLVIRSDFEVFATPNIRLKKTIKKTMVEENGYPFRVHFAYSDK